MIICFINHDVNINQNSDCFFRTRPALIVTGTMTELNNWIVCASRYTALDLYLIQASALKHSSVIFNF